MKRDRVTDPGYASCDIVKGMKHIGHTLYTMILAASMLAPLSCTPRAEPPRTEAPHVEPPHVEQEQPAGEKLLPAAGQSFSSKEAADELAKLGFYVFESPQAVPSFPPLPALERTAAGVKSNSEPLANNSFTGTVTILNFWATWCPPCKKEMPSIEKLHQEMKGYDFRIAAVSVGEKTATVADFIQREKYTFPVFLDEQGKLGGIMATQGIPTTYILDASGKIIAGTVGAREYDSPEFILLMQRMSGKE